MPTATATADRFLGTMVTEQPPSSRGLMAVVRWLAAPLRGGLLVALLVAGTTALAWRDHRSSVAAISALAADVQPGDSRDDFDRILAKSVYRRLVVADVSAGRVRVGNFRWPANWVLLVDFDAAGTVSAIRVRTVDSLEMQPRDAPADRTAK